MTAAAMAAPGLKEAFLKEYPLGRIGTSEDIAAMAVFLCSDECFLSGQNLSASSSTDKPQENTVTMKRCQTSCKMEGTDDDADNDGGAWH